MLNPVASPLLATDVAWPPTLLHAASLDTLCEDSRRFAAMLDEKGMTVDYKCYEGCRHGFTHEAFAREYDPCASKDVLTRAAAFVRRMATAAVTDEGGVA